MSDPFKELVEEMARLAVPEDDTEENRGRREAAASGRLDTLGDSLAVEDPNQHFLDDVEYDGNDGEQDRPHEHRID